MIPALAILALTQGDGEPPSNLSGEIQRLDSLCSEVLSLSQNHEPEQIFADFANAYDRYASEDWKSVPDRATLDRLAENTFPYTQAYVWGTESATFVQMVFQGPSGDSVLNADYCFDAAGRLVRSEGTFNTFHAIDSKTDDAAPISRINTTYYAQNGEKLRSDTIVLDLKTQEPAPQRSFMDHEDPVFMTTSSLPFSELLAK